MKKIKWLKCAICGYKVSSNHAIMFKSQGNELKICPECDNDRKDLSSKFAQKNNNKKTIDPHFKRLFG